MSPYFQLWPTGVGFLFMTHKHRKWNQKATSFSKTKKSTVKELLIKMHELYVFNINYRGSILGPAASMATDEALFSSAGAF